jgi:CRISPR-associated endonuclease/helicase Cas3
MALVGRDPAFADRDRMLYAHSFEGRPEQDWEPLDRHLAEVGALAREFADIVGAGGWGYLAGLWHDLGKVRPEFQARLRGAREQVEHAGLGAALAESKHPWRGLPVAFAIAGHHSGLANHRARLESELAPLDERLERARPLLSLLDGTNTEALRDAGLPALPEWIERLAHAPGTRAEKAQRVRLALEFFTRFLTSALVDADRLCTERFMQPGLVRETPHEPLSDLNARLDAELARIQRLATPDSAVNQARRAVLLACQERAADAPGLFTLTVPTGGGKTLAAMSFGLRHALQHGLRRVFMVIPFTSIIEQNAAVYRRALGPDAVIEHHTNFDEAAATDESPEREVRRRFAVENWDAPVIVTTSVQFLETLFTNHPSRLRKLHNIARSAVVFDEVQTLPPHLLAPILDALGQLRDYYGCSLVLSTATPPALARVSHRPVGLTGLREIVPKAFGLARTLKRVRVRWPTSPTEITTWDALAGQLVQFPQVLTIVHRRDDARVLTERLPAEGRFHLSALMCPAHRSRVLAEARQALRQGQICRLVATQIIEAGVDIDFPVVYRALAGLDSLAQAAGRCNREGRLRDEQGKPSPGAFVVFRAETRPPAGVLRLAQQATEHLLAADGEGLDLHDPVTCERFFDTFYCLTEPDPRGIQTSRREWNFATVAHDFRLIDDDTAPVIVPWGDGAERIEAYRRTPGRDTRRALQPYVVSLPRRQVAALQAVGAIDQVDPSVAAVAAGPALKGYTEAFGLDVSALSGQLEPESFIY